MFPVDMKEPVPPTPEGTVLPVNAGIGLRSPHIDAVLERRPEVGFLEVHTENYFGGGAKLKKLERLRHDYPLSFHGVGLSMGRADGLDKSHLDQIKRLIDRYEPFLVSEHLSWSGLGSVYVPDLLPLPYRKNALEIMVEHVDRFQNAIGRRVLIENPSRYLPYENTELSEPEFLLEVARRTGCGILLDVNNIYVSAQNLDFETAAYLSALGNSAEVGEFHVAGHAVVEVGTERTLIDTHGDRVSSDVWALLLSAMRRFGDHPVLIEWDTDIPALEVLLAEAGQANAIRALAVAEEAAHV